MKTPHDTATVKSVDTSGEFPTTTMTCGCVYYGHRLKAACSEWVSRYGVLEEWK